MRVEGERKLSDSMLAAARACAARDAPLPRGGTLHTKTISKLTSIGVEASASLEASMTGPRENLRGKAHM